MSARIWNAVKSLGVPKPVGSSQSTPTSLLAVIGSVRASALKSGSSQARATSRAAGRGADLLGELGEEPVLRGGEDALLDAQFAQRDLEHLEVGDLVDHRLDRAVVVVVVVVVVVCHARSVQLAACSQCSGISVRRVSVAGPLKSSHSSAIVNWTT